MILAKYITNVNAWPSAIKQEKQSLYYVINAIGLFKCDLQFKVFLFERQATEIK